MLALEFAVFSRPGAQHPGRQLGSPLFSGGHNSSSGMLFGANRPAEQHLAHWVCICDLELASTLLATATL